MPLSEWSEKQVLGLTAGVAVGVLLIMGGLVAYTYVRYTKVGAETDTLKRQNKKLEKKADMLEEKTKELENLTRETEAHEKRLPDGEDRGHLRSQVSEQSRNAEIDITSFTKVAKGAIRRRPGKSGRGSKERYVPVKFRMEASGKFHQFGQFLNRLENRLERIVTVKGFELTANKDGLNPKKPELGIKLQFEAYRYKTR